MGGVLLIQSTKSNICLPTVAKDCAHIGKWDNSQRNSLKYRDRRLSHMTPAVWRVVYTGVTLQSETFNAQNRAQYLKTIVYSEIVEQVSILSVAIETKRAVSRAVSGQVSGCSSV